MIADEDNPPSGLGCAFILAVATVVVVVLTAYAIAHLAGWD